MWKCLHVAISTGCLLAVTFCLSGCTSVVEFTPVPRELLEKVEVADFQEVRYAYDSSESAFVADFCQAIRTAEPGPDGIALLALSGGGANGAYGAGLLCGWSETGLRPTFQIVTGVSTGALAAPFAFLGADYDDKLRSAYTQVTDSDIFRMHFARSALSFFLGDSLGDTSPMMRTIARLIDQPMLDKIAVEHRKGRRLYVCTTELVGDRAIFWNLSAIAASGRPGALELFRKLLLASASLPVLFPPQYINVKFGDQTYTEIHVDGGLSRQVFLHMHGAGNACGVNPAGERHKLTAYIIRNAKVESDYYPLHPNLTALTSRTMHSLIRAQGIGDLHQIFEQALLENAQYRLAVIPSYFAAKKHSQFDTEYMKSLFDVGFLQATTGFPWHDRPPYFQMAAAFSTSAFGVKESNSHPAERALDLAPWARRERTPGKPTTKSEPNKKN